MRYPVPLLALGVAIAVVGPGSLSAAQAGSSASGQWVVPRTPDGRPDLQGNWTSATLTPLQRAEGQGPVLTWEEVERREQEPELAPAFDGLLIREVAEPSDPNQPAAAPQARGSVYGIYENVYTIGQSDRVAIVDGEPRSSLVTNPPDGRVPPRMPEGERRAAEYREFRSQFGQYDHPELRPLTERCLMSQGSSAGPPMLPNYPGWYNNNYTIVQTADHVLIMAEMVHDARIIRIGSGPRLPPQIRPWMGDSWGHWEGDVLVVETTNLHPQQRFRGNSSENLTVIERFSRIDEETILYEFAIDDPTTYTEPWGGEIPMKALNDLLYEFACQEGNYSLSGILSGARYQENLEAQGPTEPR